MMSLDELLALLPDNSSGDISAADMRTVVSELYTAAHSAMEAYAYEWTNQAVPATGKVTTDVWSVGATTMLLSETTSDGMPLAFGTLDIGGEVHARLNTTGVISELQARVTGPSVDMGNYRSVPITVVKIVGPMPANNSAITVTVVVAA